MPASAGGSIFPQSMNSYIKWYTASHLASNG